MSIADNIKTVRGEIELAAARVGKSGKDIMLVAAAKMNSADRVREAISAGVDAIGENRVQELVEKSAQSAYEGAPLHFIGHLQKNKAKNVVGQCDVIESVDSAELLALINRLAFERGIVQNVMIEVNIGREQAKAGILPEALPDLLGMAAEHTSIKVIGLMGIPPITDNYSKNYVFFDELYKLYVDMRSKKYDNSPMQLLSMGMSDSYKEAIGAGANVVRVGSAIFGRRM